MGPAVNSFRLDITSSHNISCEEVTFLLSLLAAKGLGALIGGLLLLTRTSPGLVDPELVVRADTLYVRTTLTHAFTRDLNEVLESGTTVAVGYTATLLARDAQGGEVAFEPERFFHSAQYDPVEQRFVVYRSELTGSPDTLVYAETRRDAENLLITVFAPLGPLAALPAELEYSCRLEAALNTVAMEGMSDNELDLNVFWNYRYPRATSRWIDLATP